MKRVLMVAYHYPPLRISSGIQRTLKFSQYLRDFGWEPLVLTIDARAYQETGQGQVGEIPADMVLKRAFGLDTARHLALAGRYLDSMALPDRWSTWWLGGVVSGLAMIRRYRPRAIWSTYPLATAHLIGLTLSRLSGLPWFADFRDSMTEADYPREQPRKRVYQWIERHTVARCTRAVFTTPGTARMYAERYPEIPADRWAEIENGFDEENFAAAEAVMGAPRGAGEGPLTLVHSGILYPSERDPWPFFGAVAELKRCGSVSAENLRVVLRATAHDGLYAPLLAELGIADIVRLEPGVEYAEALREMLAADALLIFQAANCNHQIPAKIYEYLRARRPILALTDPAGDTATVLRRAEVGEVVKLNDQAAIRDGLLRFLGELREGRAPVASDAVIARNSRRGRTEALAGLLDEVAAPS